MKRNIRFHSVCAITALSAAMALGLSPAAAQAAATSSAAGPTPGEISYVSDGNLVVAQANGSGPVVVAHGVTGPAAWLPDGSRLLYIQAGDVWSVRPTGQDAIEITNTGEATSVAVDGSGIAAEFIGTAIGHGYSSGTMIHGLQAAAVAQTAGDGASMGDEENVAFVPVPLPAEDISLFDLVGQGATYIYGQSDGGAFPVIQGSEANVSADGTQITVIRPDAGGVEQVFTAPLTENYQNQPTATAGTATQITIGTADAAEPHFSPDGKDIVYSTGGAVQVITTAGVLVRTIPNATDPSWQPVLPNAVDRVAGGTAIGTGIAASQADYATLGAAGDLRAQAGAVVLSRSDGYWDALAGSAFAVVVHGPLLITPPSALNSGVLAEIKRILPKGGKVYLLGGLAALSQHVQDQVTSAGYVIQRFAGSDMYDTAVLVDEQLQQIEGWDGEPYNVIIATGAQYYDALAAGAAAGAVGATVVVLTDGTKMPPESAAYLNTLSPRTTGSGGQAGQVNMFTAGGPGTTAFANALASRQLWPNYSSGLTIQYTKFVGGNAEDTALDLASYFDAFQELYGPKTVAVATMKGWYDALTGGAMIGAQGGFLLLTEPSALYPGDAAYLDARSGSIQTVDVLGGYEALPSSLDPQIGAQIGLPGTIQFGAGLRVGRAG
jgi:hypothetical protein